MGVIFITHDLGLVSEIADRVVVMYKGEIAEQGTIKEILQSPAHPYTRALLACRPALHPKGMRLPVVSDFMGEKDAGKEQRNQPGRKVEKDAEKLVRKEVLGKMQGKKMQGKI